MAGVARAALLAGFPAVVDGAFLKRVERDRFRALARELDARFALVSCEAPADVLRDRVAARHLAGRDASEADVDVLERQIGWQERPGPDEEADCTHVDTQAEWAAVEQRCGSLAGALTKDQR
jgi:hypothetical protein